MRHLAALLVAVLVAPSSWLLLAFGQDRSARAFTDAQAGGAFHTTDLVRPVACLAGAGLLIGLLAMLRFSPLPLTVTGVGYTAVFLALLVAPTWVLGLFPHSVTVATRAADPTTPLRTGTALMLGVSMLLIATISAGRRRRRPPGTVEEPAEEPEQTTAAVHAEQRSPRAGESGLKPSRAAAEPGVATRRLNQPRNLGNRRQNSYVPASNRSSRWHQARQSSWPYP